MEVVEALSQVLLLDEFFFSGVEECFLRDFHLAKHILLTLKIVLVTLMTLMTPITAMIVIVRVDVDI